MSKNFIRVTLLVLGLSNVTFAQLKPNFMTHEEAIRLSLAEPLVFVGQFIPDGIISRKPACLLRNKFVTIAYTYCSPDEIQALSIRIFAADTSRGSVRMYAEIPSGQVSAVERSEYYDVLWSTSASPQIKGYSHNFDSFQYEDFEPEIRKTDSCLIFLPDNTNKPTARCTKGIDASVVKKWGPNALSFWNKPSANWYKLQKNMRQVIEQSVR